MGCRGVASAKPTPCRNERKAGVGVRLGSGSGAVMARRDADSAMEIDYAVQAARLRYLNAMGIESWIRRSSPAAVSEMAREDEATEAQGARAEGAAPAVPIAEMLAEEPVAAVRSLLAAEPGAEPAPVPPPPSTAQRETAPPPASSAQVPGKSSASVTPEFRLLVLHLAGSVLLVDESLLDRGALQTEQLLLLADVLRSARLLVHGDATGPIEHQVFYWPQVDDEALDQGLPRAIEALAYHVRMRLEGGGGPVLNVVRDGEPETGSAIARDSIAELDAKVLEIAADVLDLQAAGSVRAQVWARLCTLEPAP